MKSEEARISNAELRGTRSTIPMLNRVLDDASFDAFVEAHLREIL